VRWRYPIAASAVLGGVLWLAGAGWSAAVVSSGSMRPAIRPGDVVLTAPARTDRIRAGSVVTFRKPGRPMLHRVIGTAAGGRLVTKGDANPVADAAPVPRDAVTGVARWRVPYAGLPVLWWTRAGGIGPALAGLGLLCWVRSRRSGRRPS
jgi:signal peptidase